MIKGIAHICFHVKDLAVSRVFYCGKLKLRHAFDFLDESGRTIGMYIHVGGRNFIELYQGDPKPADGPSYKHFCLEVDDVDSTAVELRERGVEVSEPRTGKDRSRQCWLCDPDGNRIELHGYNNQSRQAPFLE